MTAQLTIKTDESNEHPRKSLVDKIKLCEERRIDLDIIENIFEKAGVDVAHRWGSLTNEAVRCSDTKASQIEEKLTVFLENHIRYDNKIVMVYDHLSEDNIQEFIEAFIKVYSDSTSFDSTEYIADSCHQITENLIFYNFRIVREVSERKELTMSDLGDLGEEVLGQYSRIIGYRPVKITCFDALAIDIKNKRLILQLDLGSIVLANAVDKFFHNLRVSINKAIRKAGVTNCRIPDKTQFINLYTTIQNFYDNGEGEVTKASFSTSKNNHHETLRDRARDIRKAEYHLRGKAAEEALGGKIRPYRISKRFERITNTWPQVYTGVHYRYFNKAISGEKNLYEAHIFDIKSYNDYLFIIDKILANRTVI
ncbi:hypothetical protein [Acinetobacter populi]|uniref:Uncharacterized protein n=1 Tax=Acinetobacter populi TaxID=1582270 RepID=A0A1Z9Z253_9GAMM|nr:hypothetical protein [Acinetobacter populi]OUY08535.1 hypothetical protein CAP51_02655 [Acinetobacter populi]